MSKVFPVKLYEYSGNVVWKDIGVGFLSLGLLTSTNLNFQILNENKDSILHNFCLNSISLIQKQENRILQISENSIDYALSFLSCESFDLAYTELIKFYSPKAISFSPENSVINEHTYVTLPKVELANLNEITSFLSSYDFNRKYQIIEEIEKSDFIEKLIECFHVSEDLENIDGLTYLYSIFKNMIMLNSHAVLTVLFADNVIMDVIGILEYDPMVTNYLPSDTEEIKKLRLDLRKKHRHYISDCATFKQAIELTDAELLKKIQQTYKVQYIQDVILPTPSLFEENLQSALSSFIFFNKISIVGLFLESKQQLLKTLFNNLLSGNTLSQSSEANQKFVPDQDWKKNLILLLRELCQFSQSLQPQGKEHVFMSLLDRGLLSIIKVLLPSSEDEALISALLEILLQIVDSVPSAVRQMILSEDQSYLSSDKESTFLHVLINKMISDKDTEMETAMQISHLIKELCDPENMLTSNNVSSSLRETTEFLAFFYRNNMHVLIEPLMTNTLSCSKPINDDYRTAHMCSIIIELLSFFTLHHSSHAKSYIINKDLLSRFIVFMNSRHKFLVLAVIRLIRKMLTLKEENYVDYFIKIGVLRHMVLALVNHRKNDLLNSSLLEFFDYISSTQIDPLISEIMDVFYEEYLFNISYTKLFQKMKDEHDIHKLTLSTAENEPNIFLKLNDPNESALKHLSNIKHEQEVSEERYFESDTSYGGVDESLKTEVEENSIETMKKSENIVSSSEDSCTEYDKVESSCKKVKLQKPSESDSRNEDDVESTTTEMDESESVVNENNPEFDVSSTDFSTSFNQSFRPINDDDSDPTQNTSDIAPHSKISFKFKSLMKNNLTKSDGEEEDKEISVVKANITPKTPPSTLQTINKAPSIASLVDYPDEDSDDDE